MPTIQKMVASCWSGTHTLTCSSATMLPTSCRRRSYVFDGIVLSPPQKGTLSLNGASWPRRGRGSGERRCPLPSAALRSDYGRPALGARWRRGGARGAGGEVGRGPSGGGGVGRRPDQGY